MKKASRAFAASALTALTLAALPAQANDGLRPLIGLGLTFGGEKLATVAFTNGTSQSITTGGLVHLFGGVEYKVDRFAAQASVGYHVSDTSAASNGSIKFVRYPVEVLGFGYITDQFRLGGGLRKATGAKFTSSGVVAGAGNQRFTSSTGLVLQGDYFFGSSRASLYGRYVIEKFKANGSSTQGDHGGFGVAYRF
jgi:hypothetical protein